jgi:hypothetical protein
MDMNFEKNKLMRISRQHPQQILTDQKTTGECGIFQPFGWCDDEQCKMYSEVKHRTAMAKTELDNKILFASKLDSHLRTKLKEFYIWSVKCTVLNVRHLGIQIRNALKVFNCDAGEGWRSVRPTV